jgi:aryl-alcohol dehydrogenase-like predicted oxidoreductase
MFRPGMTMIATRSLGRAGLALSELSLGCAQLGNLYREISDDDATATVDQAWELGIRYFDTAPHYGLGLSERRLGAALARRSRTDYVLSSKVGRLLAPMDVASGLDDEGFVVPATHRRVWDFSRDGIRRSLEESLDRLGVDRLDIVYLHDPSDFPCSRAKRTRLPRSPTPRAFPLADAAVVTVCVGARSPQQVERNVALYRETVGSELWADLKAHGLLREDAPPF